MLRTGISPDTIHRHVELVAGALGRPAPKRTTKVQLERGRAELLAIPGVGESTIEKLYSGGVIDAETLVRADPHAVAAGSGIPVPEDPGHPGPRRDPAPGHRMSGT